MCYAVRMFADGGCKMTGCPPTETKLEEYQAQLIRFGRSNPDMTLREFAQVLGKSVWWIFAVLTDDCKPVEHPLIGVQFLTHDGERFTVKTADRFAVWWKEKPHLFSLIEDLKGMQAC